MNRMRTIFVAAIFAAALAFGQHSLADRQVLNNEGIVDLAKAGFSEAFILDLVQIKRTKFDITVEGLTLLAKKGLSERVIRAIVANSNKPESGGAGPSVIPEAQRAPRQASEAPFCANYSEAVRIEKTKKNKR